LDVKLSEGEKADVEAWSSLVQHRLHHAQLYNWWAESSNYDEVTHIVFSRALPFPLNFFLPSRHKKTVLTQLAAAGFVDDRVAYDEAEKCYKALSVKLGHKKYLYGDHPNSLDAVVFGFLATQLIPDLPQRKLHYLISQHQNLVDYVNNILSIYFNSKSPIGIDVEPAQRWLKGLEEERSAQEASALEAAQTTKDTSAAWSIAFGIGATVLFLATQNLQFYLLWSSVSQRFFKKDDTVKHVGKAKKYTREQEEERSKWFGGSADLVQEESGEEDGNARRGPTLVHDPDENPMKAVHRFAPDDDAEVFIGDDGNAYDWDERYLEEMETGSDIPEDYEDLGEDEEDEYE